MADMERAAEALSLMRSIGLIGQRLAVFEMEEEAIAKQLATRMGIEHRSWLTELVKGMINEAVASRDLELRIEGVNRAPAVQNIHDAVAASSRARVAEGVALEREAKQFPPAPKKGKLAKVWKPYPREVHQDEAEERAAVLVTLIDELERFGAPVLSELEKSLNPIRARESLFGKYRVSTVRRYLAYWQNFRKWVLHSSGKDFPVAPTQLVDYLYAREEEGMGASIPMAVMKAAMWFERTAGIADWETLTSSPMVQMVTSELTVRLESKAPPIRRAPRLLSCFLPALEDVVMDKYETEATRIGAWLKLLKTWASLRFDDLANIKMENLKFYDGKLAGILRKTKTTGAGKRVRELPIFVSEEAYVHRKQWLETGLRMVLEMRPEAREYLVGSDIMHGEMKPATLMSYTEAVLLSVDAMSSMREGERELEPMVPLVWVRFWTEHSERATLPSGLACLGVAKSDRDMLGRWAPEGSDQYIRTYNNLVGGMQGLFADAIRRGDAYHRLDEGSTLEDLKKWLVDKWGVPFDEADSAVESWKAKITKKGVFESMLIREEGENTPTEVAETEEVLSPCESSEPTDLEPEPMKRRKMSRVDSERQTGYIVVFNRINRGTLHRAGDDGCWMARTREFRRAEVYKELPKEDSYTKRCRLCWPMGDESSVSTSDSEEVLQVPAKVLEGELPLIQVVPLVE